MGSDVQNLITEHIDLWTSAIEQKKSAGRGSSKKHNLYGIKKLRELILELAVRGKLVPQDPNDEPASVLLEKITEKRDQFVKDKKIKKPKKLPEIQPEDQLFELPIGWEWARLGQCVNIVRGITFPASAKNSEREQNLVACLRTANVQAKVDWDDLIYVDKSYVKRNDQKILVGDIVMSMANSRELVGKVAFVDSLPVNEASFGGFLSVLRPWMIDPAFLMILLRTPMNRNILVGSASQTTNIANISLEKLNPLVLTVPPLSEQQRIAAKVDELMALCDQLEVQTENNITAHQLLVETLLNTLTQSQNADELAENWQRLVEHFDTLFTTEHSIDQLKQTILQLAVMGKLVPQDPNDEPASVLLERIAAEKEQLIKDKKIKKQKPLPLITEDEKPFESPLGWEFVRMGDLTEKLGSGSTPRGGKSSYVDEGVVFLRSQNVWNNGLKLDDVVYISTETHKKMNNTKVAPNDVLLNITGASLGRSTIFPAELKEANVSQHVTIIRLIEPGMARFIHLGILSPIVQSLVWGRQVGMAIEGLSKKVLEVFEFPVPPLAEQNRIIEKVDHLMVLCDQLKTRLHDAQQNQLKLADAIGYGMFGNYSSIPEKTTKAESEMKISTQLSLGDVPLDDSAIIAVMLKASDEALGAKDAWRKSKLDLPAFYRQLKKEIAAGFIAKPAKADFIQE